MRTLILILCFFSTISLFGANNIFSSKHFIKDVTELVNTYYPHHHMKQSVTYNEQLGVITRYKITFDSGTLIVYNKCGKIILFECYENDFVPDVVLPKKIRKYLKKEYLGINVIKYYADYSKKEYIVVLENDLSITFN